jgi:hypothetical protein
LGSGAAVHTAAIVAITNEKTRRISDMVFIGFGVLLGPAYFGWEWFEVWLVIDDCFVGLTDPSVWSGDIFEDIPTDWGGWCPLRLWWYR